MNIVCPNCGYEKAPEEWENKLCSDCREDIDSDEDWFR
jgi:NMD protein affecting ribosome stability and mRNA decay